MDPTTTTIQTTEPPKPEDIQWADEHEEEIERN